MRIVRIFLVSVCMVLTATVVQDSVEAAGGDPIPAAADPRTWVRATTDQIGCLLEKFYDARDPKYGCGSKPAHQNVTPCDSGDEYTAGPAFTVDPHRVNPSFRAIDLEWEHGMLQAVDISLDRKYSEQDIAKRFGFSTDPSTWPDNVLDVSIQECHRDYTCISIQGFDHIGAADVDCGDKTAN